MDVYVIMRRVQETFVAMEGNNFYIFLCAFVRACVDAQTLACVCARLDLLIQHAMRRHTVIYGLASSTACFDIIS